MNQGYFQQPTLSKNQIAFISDDDLWIVPKAGGTAQRLTANKGHISSPCFSPDGNSIALISTDHSIGDIYLLPMQGGALERVTWIGVIKIIGWKNADVLFFTSGLEGYPRRETYTYELNIRTKDFKKINLGPSSFYHQGDGFQILGRHSGDSARWKRYQGGTAGVLWVQKGKSKFERILTDLKTNIARPVVLGKTIYFISDHEGVANLYSCDLSGENRKRLTHHTDYYARNLQANQSQLVYQCGAVIFVYDLKVGKTKLVPIEFNASAIQAAPRFEKWSRYFHGAAVHPTGSEVAVISRGHLFQVPPFNGVVKELDLDKNIRYSHPDYNFNGSKLLVAAAHGATDEAVYEFDTKSGTRKRIFSKINWGKIWGLKCSPKADFAAVITNRNEVYLLDLKKQTSKKIETNAFARPCDLEWSPDGRYLVYSANLDSRRTGIRIYDMTTKKLRLLVTPILSDTSPSFDPTGKYIYFLGVREFAPNYNETHFDLGFPFAIRPYVVSLLPGTPSPFDAGLENPHAPLPIVKAKNRNGKPVPAPELKIEIDFNGIDQRIEAFGLDLGGYQKVVGIKGGILYWKSSVEPINGDEIFGDAPTMNVYQYKFEDNEYDSYQRNAAFFTLNKSKTYFLSFVDSKLRLTETKNKPTSDFKIGKKDGWVDTSGVKLKVNPRAEWQQMYHEAWVFQKEHFWRRDLNKIDWDLVYKRYINLLPKVSTRAEFSDLMWEMQGELGTSHCYEMNGNYDRYGARIPLARLGATFSYNAKLKRYTILELPQGDSWMPATESPLKAMGISLNVGDQILAFNGVEFISAQDLYENLENKVGAKIELTILRKGTKRKETVLVKPNLSQSAAGYRQWVANNKKFVHEKSGGKLGYVHIPDMGPIGYAEFYRHFIVESQYDGLIVDVRYNGGGHVSQHLLKVLAQKVIGFDETRHHGLETYPMYAPGVLVALANENSGSDGDIFPHAFKLMGLGKLVGKRTWGGVIGINGQYSLRDGAYITQPEYSHWFKDVEWNIENHGVDPDIEV
ncbi:MAG: PDZ domain-containing protein, partial [Bdellovibrio sp.]|nr:PDZ domain-containing protein [Bdellovibrio sp.]